MVTFFRYLSAQAAIQDVDHLAEAQELCGGAHGGEGGDEKSDFKIKTGSFEVATFTLS